MHTSGVTMGRLTNENLLTFRHMKGVVVSASDRLIGYVAEASRSFGAWHRPCKCDWNSFSKSYSLIVRISAHT